MSPDRSHPDFDAFTRWLSSRTNSTVPGEAEPSATPAPRGARARFDSVFAAARLARDETLSLQESARPNASTSRAASGNLEVLQLLAAADKSEESRPPELVTAKGFRVTLAYDEGPEEASICVLVRCPPEMIDKIQGETVFLWNGSLRFELGQFDSDGKAIGTLPAGIEISLSDFAAGSVKLEEPFPPSER